MSATVISFSAIRVAHLLHQNAPADSAADFIAHMACVAHSQQDPLREAFWHEVGTLVRRRAGASA